MSGSERAAQVVVLQHITLTGTKHETGSVGVLAEHDLFRCSIGSNESKVIFLFCRRFAPHLAYCFSGRACCAEAISGARAGSMALCAFS